MRSFFCLVTLCALLACPAARHGGDIVIDCTVADQGKIGALIMAFEPLLSGEAPDWDAIERQAIGAGVTIGGCALANVVQEYLTPPRNRTAPGLTNGRAARDTLEHFRVVHANGATFHSAQGDL